MNRWPTRRGTVAAEVRSRPARAARAGLRAPLRVLLAGLLAAASLHAAEPPSHTALVQALREGGHVIYFRHGATDWGKRDHVNAAGDWVSCDPEQMRQLSGEGRAAARRVGEAMRALGIPVGRVLSSQYCRCVQTAELLAVGEVEPTLELMNVMAAEFAGGKEVVVERARRLLRQAPPAGQNTVLVAHGFLLRDATGDYPGEMGAAIYRPSGAEPLKAVALLTAEDWEALAREQGRAP